MKNYCILLFIVAWTAHAADSVDVTFRYNIAGFPSGLSVPGEFNSWNNTAAPMSYQGGILWIRTIRLAVGGNPGGSIPGAWQYKFYYSGVTMWPNDPLNHHVNHADNDNSFIYLKDPTIYQFLPNQRNPVVTSSTPAISAYLYPKVGSTVDTSALSITIDGAVYAHLGSSYNFSTKQFIFTPPSPLQNGNHTVILSAGTNADTVTFFTQGGFVQLTNEFPFTTWKSSWQLNGIVQDSSVTSARIVRNGVDTFSTSVAGKSFSLNVPLVEGANSFVALADSSSTPKISSPVNFVRKVNHAPHAVLLIRDSDILLFPYIDLDANFSTDPDSGQSPTLSFLWSADSSNPSFVNGVNGATTPIVTIHRPSVPGDYGFTLIVTDTDGNKDTTRNYFTLKNDNFTVTYPTQENNPPWAQKARIYFLFPKAASSAGTINAAAQRLQWIKDLGFNVIWMMPVMKNAYPIDNNYGPGYNIIDFYNVAPEYGTNQDFKNFVSQAHALGLKVILDVTPNHSSRFHPWSVDAHTFKMNSPYWGWYEHQTITANTNGLGDCLDADSFNYYCGFSDQLLNFNWKDIDMQAEMINIYKYWIEEFGVDGYRLDVYWGPHRRYGEQYMGKPVRDALKHIKPDILLLGEDDGTGAGTQTIYADYSNGGINGGVDAAYDWKLYHNDIEFFGFSGSAITGLHTDIDNGGYYPGKNALYMRFMEDQDEDRIVYFYSNNFSIDDTTTFKRTMPMASVLFTAPGVPTLWNGQEIGWGYGITGAKEARDRSVIDWNYKGKYLLAPHYQKLATIRGEFPAFTQHKRDTNNDNQVNSADSSDFVLVPSSNGSVYAFTRPYPDQNGLTIVNFSNSGQTTRLNLMGTTVLRFTGGIQAGNTYYVNDLYSNSHQQMLGADLDSVVVSLSPYGTAIYTVSTTPDSSIITNPITDVITEERLPTKFELEQNYPNPFNPKTELRFTVPKEGFVSLKIYDVLGREMATLVSENKYPGMYTVSWNGSGAPSGVYFYRLFTSSFTSVKKMLLVR